MSDAQNHRYFRAKEGHWKGPFRFALTDWSGIRRSGIRFRDRWALMCLAMVASPLGSPMVSTTVDYTTHGHLGLVGHTTRLSARGVTLFRSAETITLDDDGQSFVVVGRSRVFPFVGTGTVWTGHGAVAADYDGAMYELPWFGLTLNQSTRMTTDGLEFTQSTPYTTATLVLRWERPLKDEPFRGVQDQEDGPPQTAS